MSRRLMTILISAFLIAAGASFVVYRLVGRQIRGNIAKHATVIVATRDLEVGTLIKPADLKTEESAGNVPADAVLNSENAVGRGVITPIYAGESIVSRRLAPAGSGGGLAATIPPGMRACAVKVNDVVGLAGFVLPGMRVDVLVAGTATGPQSAAGAKVKTLLQNIEVLSAGKNFQRDTDGKPIEVQVVNLLVTPEQAELLSLANNETKIQLVLRNPIDRETAKTPGTELASVFGGTEKAPVITARPAPAPKPAALPPVAVKAADPAKPAPPPPYIVRVINGSKQTEQKFVIEGEAW